jgi:Xaa-Pro aminopeptidase
MEWFKMDYTKRTQHFINLMIEAQVDWFVITNLYNVRYLSGFTGSHATLLIGQEKKYIITDGRYDEQVRLEVKDYEPVIQGKRKELEVMQDLLGDVFTRRIAFEAEHTSFARVQELEELIRTREWLPARNGVEDLRECKDADEIAIIRRALKIAEDSRQAILPEIKEGMTERELAHRLEEEMWKRGAQDKSFDTIVLFGKRTSLPHGKPSDEKLKKGDAILTDFGCRVEGYCSDITRMAFLGEPLDIMKHMYGIVNAARQHAEENLRAGLSTKQADEFARQVIRAERREPQFMHGLGHGVGLEIHEAPRLSYLTNSALKSGQVVTIEPGIYHAGVGGIRIENMAVIHNDRCEVLNESTTDMVIL